LEPLLTLKIFRIFDKADQNFVGANRAIEAAIINYMKEISKDE
jgi:hypothetical protein